MSGGETVWIRPAEAGDDSAIAAIDTSFEATEAYTVNRTDSSFHLVRQRLSAPLNKIFPLPLPGPAPDFVRVALIGDRPVGFVAAEVAAWHRRLVLSRLYIDAGHRRQGIARELLTAACDYGGAQGQDHVWVETTNLNVPAIDAFCRLGFGLCGLDVDFYRGTPIPAKSRCFSPDACRSERGVAVQRCPRGTLSRLRERVAW